MTIKKSGDPRRVCTVTNLSKSFSTPDGTGTLEILRNISLALDKGESVAVTGPSGSGKTTLLNCIATLDRPDSGAVILDGDDVATLSPTDLSRLRNRKVGIVFQQHYLLPYCTLLENVLIPTIPWPGPGTADDVHNRTRFLIERVGLTERMHSLPETLSGGECQRAAVVRALINMPLLLCADEPTGSLDRASADSLGDLLVTLNREEKTALLVVTHSERLAERMDRRYFLNDGCLEPVER